MEDAEQLANSTGKILSTHEWSHSRAWMGLCVTRVRCGESLKIRVNSPMRVRLKIRHGDMWARPRYEPLPPAASPPPPARSKTLCSGPVIRKKAEAKKQFVYLTQEPRCAVSDCFRPHLFSGSRPLADGTFHKWFNNSAGLKTHAFLHPITTWCKLLSADAVFVNVSTAAWADHNNRGTVNKKSHRQHQYLQQADCLLHWNWLWSGTRCEVQLWKML